MSTPKNVLELAQENRPKTMDIKFAEAFGTWQRLHQRLSRDVDADQTQGA